MKTTNKSYPYLIAVAVTVAGAAALIAQTQKPRPKPKHINSMIDLFEQGQPAYYMGSHDGTMGGFEQGKKDAQTWADYIVYDMEHAPFNVEGLAEYMRGLAAGGPTKTGHPTPAVIVVCPVNGTDEITVRANAWMFHQVLATGVHGLLLAHADNPGAVRAFVEAARFPIHQQGVGQEGLKEGRRGIHGAPMASKIWGISQQEYIQKADPWPLNPNGELLLGVKIEDKYAAANVEETLKIPGLTIGENGGADMSLSFGSSGRGPGRGRDPRVQEAEAKNLVEAKRHKLYWNGITRDAAAERIKEGYMLGIGEDTAAAGRKVTNRVMP